MSLPFHLAFIKSEDSWCKQSFLRGCFPVCCCSHLVGWRGTPPHHSSFLKCSLAAQAESAFSSAGLLHMLCERHPHAATSGQVWSPEHREAFCRGQEDARETALPRLCSLGQDPQILAPLCLFSHLAQCFVLILLVL